MQGCVLSFSFDKVVFLIRIDQTDGMGGRTLDQPSLELSPKVLSAGVAHLKCGMLFTVSQGESSLYTEDSLAASCPTLRGQV